jgi:hypothetical protein
MPWWGAPMVPVQVRACLRKVCKTVGSAYVGSNPTPATLFPQVKPVSSDGGTGFCVPVGAVRGPSVGQLWARTGSRLSF